MACTYYLLLQAGSMMKLTRMFDDGKSFETVNCNLKIFCLVAKLAWP